MTVDRATTMPGIVLGEWCGGIRAVIRRIDSVALLGTRVQKGGHCDEHKTG
jgi:hypothetical protein